MKDGTSLVLKEKLDNGDFVIVSSETKNKKSQIDASEFKEKYSGYLILAKELNSAEKQERGGIGSSAHLEKVSGSTFKLWQQQWYQTFCRYYLIVYHDSIRSYYSKWGF